ncbi:beta-ketoacyl-ACP synthase [Blastochloris tepida]|uniref:Beta-ketoacyl-ACP synthase II n=1 Tax=Blastochloris tepida TaxID=2233851 RepID=A0A348G164_9HYPH|nr:beta-ketoacyl-ACP synthase [Blastochloris tepida]BBF93297.1 beta-ketoacyl-ACP synthase II [Blastochloris tepida]
MPDRREAWITGIGLVSSLGEGVDAHYEALASGAGPKVDETRFAPYPVHPMAPLDLDKQIPKRGDQRQMEPWQRYGTYTAGLALESAGIKGNTEILSRTHMIVAAGGGERDNSVDIKILDGLRTAGNKGQFLNERLMGDLRPTLFLAQLSNLLAGNISIVHGVVGSSRTFMGEEASGVDAVRIALSRLHGGTGDIFLVGGAFNAEREDMLLLFELGGALMHGAYAPVWERAAGGGGLALGSMAAFLVLEEKAHAEARAAKPFARLASVQSGRSRRNAGDVAAAVTSHLDALGPLDPASSAILSGAVGAETATSEERAALAGRGLPVRATASLIGAGIESQFPVNIALAAIALSKGKLFAPFGADAIEAPFAGPLKQVAVTSVGHWRGEAAALVEAVD